VSELRLRRDALEWRDIQGEVVAVDVRTSTYVSANASGAVLWRSLAEGTTRDELVARLVEAFGIDQAQAGTDVDRFVDDLRDKALLAE
jgi:hypothetical protein